MLNVQVVDSICLLVAPARAYVLLGAAAVHGEAAGCHLVALYFQPQVNVVAKGVGLDPGGVREVAGIVEGTGLNLVIDDPDQALGVGLVCGRGVSGDCFPAQLALVTEIHADVVAAYFDSSCH
ncbi:hypothetical protein D3C81_1073410 [compost metagenome]